MSRMWILVSVGAVAAVLILAMTWSVQGHAGDEAGAVIWAALQCSVERAGRTSLRQNSALDRIAGELVAIYRERGQQAALEQARSLGYQADVRILSAAAEDLANAQRNPCNPLWFAPIPGSPGLVPRDDPSVAEVGFDVGRAAPHGETGALVVVLIWQ